MDNNESKKKLVTHKKGLSAKVIINVISIVTIIVCGTLLVLHYLDNDEPEKTKPGTLKDYIEQAKAEKEKETYIPAKLEDIPKSTPTPIPESAKCVFCKTNKAVYSETIGGVKYSICSSCTDYLTDVNHHQDDIDFYEKLYNACVKSMNNEEICESVGDNVYEIVNSTVDFTFSINGKNVVLLSTKDAFLKNLEYILGKNFNWSNGTRLTETTYKMTIDFGNKTITKDSAPTKSQYAK